MNKKMMKYNIRSIIIQNEKFIDIIDKVILNLKSRNYDIQEVIQMDKKNCYKNAGYSNFVRFLVFHGKEILKIYDFSNIESENLLIKDMYSELEDKKLVITPNIDNFREDDYENIEKLYIDYYDNITLLRNNKSK